MSRRDLASDAFGSVHRIAGGLLVLLLSIAVPAQNSTWTGTSSSDWFLAANWSAGVPGPALGAIIPPGTPNAPLVGGTPADCRDLNLQAGALLTLNADIRIAGNGSLNGSFAGTGGLRFVGALPASASGTALLPSLACAKSAGLSVSAIAMAGDLTLQSGTLTVAFGVTVTVGGNASFSGGTLQSGGGNAVLDVQGSVTFAGTSSTSACNIRCAGNWQSDAAFDTTTGTVTFDGPAPQTIVASGGAFNALTVAAGSTASTASPLILHGSLAVNGQFTSSASIDCDGDLTIAATGSIGLGAPMVSIARNFSLAAGATGTFAGTLVFDGTLTSTITGAPSTPIGNVSVQKSPGGTATLSGVEIGGNLSLSSGTLGLSFGSINRVLGNAVFGGGNLFSSGGNGLFDIHGSVTFSGTTATATGNMNCGGNWQNDLGFDVTSGSVNFNGTTPQTITATGGAFGSVAVAAGSVVTTNSAVLLHGDLNVQGQLATAATFDCDGNAAFAATSIVALGPQTATFARNLTITAGAVTSFAGTIVFDGTFAGTLTCPTANALGNVVVQKASGAALNLATATIGGNFSLVSGAGFLTFGTTNRVLGSAQFSGGSLTSGGGSSLFDLQGSVTFSGTTTTNPGPIACGGNWQSDAGFDVASGTVTFTGTAPRNVTQTGGAFGALTVAAGSSATFVTAISTHSHVTVSGQSLFQGGLLCGGNLVLNATADFTASNQALQLMGGLTIQPGAITSFNAPLIFTGSAVTTIANPAANPLGDVLVQKSAGGSVSLMGTTIGGTFTLTSGSLLIGFGSSNLVLGDAHFVGGSFINTGGSALLSIRGQVDFAGTQAAAVGDLNCGGNWQNDPAFDANSGVVTFDGTAPQSIAATGGAFRNVIVAAGSQVTTTTALSIHVNLTVAGHLVLGGVLDCDGDASIAAAANVDFGSSTHRFGEDLIIAAGALTSYGGAIVFDGAFAGTLRAGAANAPGAVMVQKSGGVALTLSSTTIAGDLTLASGGLVPEFATTNVILGDAHFTGGDLFGSASALLDIHGSIEFAGTTATHPGDILCRGDWQSDAGFDALSGVVTFAGTMPQTVLAAGGAFAALTVASGAQLDAASDLLIRSTLTITGTFTTAFILDGDGNASFGPASVVDIGPISPRFAANLTIAAGSQTTFASPLVFDGAAFSTVTAVAANPLADLLIQKAPGSGLVLGAAVVDGDLELASGSLTLAFSVTSQVLGNARFLGGSFLGVNGNTVLDVEGDVTFSGCAVSSPGEIRCAGNWAADAAFAPTTFGLVRLDGMAATTVDSIPAGGAVTFPQLQILNGLRRPGQDLAINAPAITIAAGGELSAGSRRLVLPALSLTVNGTIGAEAGGRLALRPGTNMVIPTGGRLRLDGLPAAPAAIEGEAGGGYALTINGLIAARNFSFSDMNAAGIVIGASASFAPLPFDLRAGRFDHPAAGGGPLLSITRNQPTEFRGIEFENTNGMAASNVRVLSGQTVTFTNWLGAFAGPAFEDDPNGLVVWAPPHVTQLSSFVVSAGAEKVFVDFVTIDEVDVTDFELERQDGPGAPFLVTAALIATGAGSSYRVLDTNVVPGTTYGYRLVEVLNTLQRNVVATGSATPFAAVVPELLEVGGSGAFADVDQALQAITTSTAVIRVQSGTYPSFVVPSGTASMIRVVAADGANVVIDTSTGPVRIENLPADRAVSLEGLTIGANPAAGAAGLLVTGCAGTVLLDGLVVTGGTAAPGIALDASDRVALQGVTATGGPGLLLGNAAAAQLLRGQIDQLNLGAGCALETCDSTIAASGVDPLAVLGSLPGLAPAVQVPAFATVGDLFDLGIETDSMRTWFLGASFGLDWTPTQNAIIELVGLLGPPSAVSLVDVGVSDVLGQDSRTYRLPGMPAFLGRTVVFQLLSYDPATGRFRISTADALLGVP